MTVFIEQLRLAEKAAENIYFAKLDRELIESLHKRIEAGKNPFQASDPVPSYRRISAGCHETGWLEMNMRQSSGCRFL
jgi:hypothetical protein